jgi:hypothetical protein
MANNSAMLAQMQNQSAQATFRDLERAGFSGMDDTTKGLLTLIGGVASYQQYRAQKAAATASRADPRSCQELLRMRNQAVQNRNAMRSVSAQPGLTSSGRPTGQAGAQQDAANAYQTIYNSYCQ